MRGAMVKAITTTSQRRALCVSNTELFQHHLALFSIESTNNAASRRLRRRSASKGRVRAQRQAKGKLSGGIASMPTSILPLIVAFNYIPFETNGFSCFDCFTLVP
jgi:hypothetical protein